MSDLNENRPEGLDPITTAVVANRFETIVREMTNTLQRAAYSTLISVSRDFSCALVTGDHELLASAQGLPVQNYGADIQSRSMCDLHSDLAPGDAFLHNDPYLGNSHPADHGVLVPIFSNNCHIFTAVAKGHVVDTGGPTGDEQPLATDIYEEGALIFPAMRVERDYQEIEDITRMARSQIRFPDMWYGDYRAMLGACRIAERRVAELVQRYGLELVQGVATEWLDYSERMMTAEIYKLPSGRITNDGRLDPSEPAPEGIPLQVEIQVDSSDGYIDVDLRDNPDCVPAGINGSEAATVSAVMQGIFSVIDPDIPHNSGAFRRVRIAMRENCIVGIPRFPASCSCATSIPTNRLINLVQSAFSQFGEGWGLAEGGLELGGSYPTIWGHDPRDDKAYQAFLPVGNNGGPASPNADGWLTFDVPCVAGLLYRSSVEIDEQRFPILYRMLRISPDTGGPGRFRGGSAFEVGFGPLHSTLHLEGWSDGYHTPPRGVRGGEDGSCSVNYRVDSDGRCEQLSPTIALELEPGEYIHSYANGGGGYGNPFQRDADAVLADVAEGWVSVAAAKDAYGVVLQTGDAELGFRVDIEQTRYLRRHTEPFANEDHV